MIFTIEALEPCFRPQKVCFKVILSVNLSPFVNINRLFAWSYPRPRDKDLSPEFFSFGIALYFSIAVLGAVLSLIMLLG